MDKCPLRPVIPIFANAARVCGALALLTTGCGIDGAEGPQATLEQLRQAQLDPGYLSGRVVRFRFADTNLTPFAELQILNRPSGSRVPGTEYWYVNRAATGLLATTALDVSVSDVTVDPPEPDYPSEQRFSEPEFPTSGWGSGWSRDPLSYGKLLGNGSSLYLRLDTTTTGEVLRVGWYQVIAATAHPQYLTPSGRFAAAGSSVPVPLGHLGYDIDQLVR